MGMTDTTNRNATTAVALVSCSGILGDLIRRRVSSVPDIAIVADLRFDEFGHMSTVLHRMHPDVVVWLLDDETMLAAHDELFCAERHCAVIAVLDDGRRSALWQLRPHRTALAPPSIDGLIDALRTVAVRP
jgi:hypothetical protein